MQLMKVTHVQTRSKVDRTKRNLKGIKCKTVQTKFKLKICANIPKINPIPNRLVGNKVYTIGR